MNVAYSDHDPRRHVVANRKLACASALHSGVQFCFMEQVHGAEVGVVHLEDAKTIGRAVARLGVDALVCDFPGITLMAKSADCPLIIIHDPITPALGIVHSGWRGTQANIIKNTIETLVREFGSRPENMTAGISPAISFDRYKVSGEVITSFKTAFSDLPKELYKLDEGGQTGKLDLSGIVEWQLRQCGVTRIERSDTCTYDRNDLFYSHRRDGDTTGRFGVFAQLPL
jgi:YfiH family protein